MKNQLQELKTVYNHQKSFNGKAYYEETDNGITLYSYNTRILKLDKTTGKTDVYWGYWSTTTGKHIREFYLQFTGEVVNKKRWLELINASKKGVKNDETF